MRCNICGGTEFADLKNRIAALCKGCASYERTRLMWMYIEKLGIRRDARILHLAPERGIHDRLSSMVDEGSYVTADLDPRRYPFAKNCVRIDLCNLDREPSGQYDLILHSHVLEHIPCNIAYTLFHLHRMLKQDGTHLFIAPFLGGRYDECFADIGDAERARRFGQNDHVRRFGRDDIASHIGKLLELPAAFDATRDFPESALEAAGIPENHWRGFHVGTVLVLARNDMKFIGGAPLARA